MNIWRRLKTGNIRWRLTIWYGSIFALLLLVYVCVASVLHYYQLKAQIFHDEIQDLETAEGLLYETPDGSVHLNEQYFNQPEMPFRLERMLEVFDEQGHVLLRNAKLGERSIDRDLLKQEGRKSYNERYGRLSDGRRVFVISHVHRIDKSVVVLRMAYETAPVFNSLWSFVLRLLGLVPPAMLLAGFFVFNMTKVALSPLSTMVRRAEAITAAQLNERLPIADPDDELGATARAFNDLLARLEASFAQLRRFTADASHELRTPLSSLRSTGEVSLQRVRSAEEYRDTIASMLEEVRRLTQLVESLLQISRADSGQIVLQREVISVVALMDDAISVVEILAEEKQQTIAVECLEPIQIFVDRAIFRQVVLNLMDNAIKYSPLGGTIRVAIRSRQGGLLEIRVCDQGPGIPKIEQTRIFDRFYRTDEGRSSSAGGHGLGLAIAKWGVDVHAGKLYVDPEYCCGACFCIELPLASSYAVSV
jgi:heavy metal sensor kinase